MQLPTIIHLNPIITFLPIFHFRDDGQINKVDVKKNGSFPFVLYIPDEKFHTRVRVVFLVFIHSFIHFSPTSYSKAPHVLYMYACL